MEVIDHVRELMLDPLANYVFQKLVDRCSVDQKNQIVSVVVKDGFGLVDICLIVQGTHTVQKLLENLTKPQISSVMSALTVALRKAEYGHYVIHCCLKIFYDKDNKYLPNEVADNYQIVTDQSGARAQLVGEMIANALHLAEDQYGHYVVRHVVELKEPEITGSLLRQLEGNLATLSCNRYGRNVVEKCLVESGEEQSTRIIRKLRSIAPELLVDPFGNYVIQSALSVSKGFVRRDVLEDLVKLVGVNLPMLESYNIENGYLPGSSRDRERSHICKLRKLQNYNVKRYHKIRDFLFD